MIRDERDERVAALTREGMSAPQIAEVVGISARTVVRIRGRMGVASRRTGYRLTEQDLIRVESLLADGASIREIAETIGCSRTSLHRRFRGRGWTPIMCGQFAAMKRQLA